jgi:hypothetical protein
MAKRKPKELTPEEAEQKRISDQETALRDARQCFFTGSPSYRFEVGEKALRGREEVIITEVFDDGLIYSYTSDQSPWKCTQWFNLRKPVGRSEVRHSIERTIHLTYDTKQLNGLLQDFYYAGIHMTPRYQRDYVWPIAKKVFLIESIFQRREIGRFVFHENRSSAIPYLEIIDGKQRLGTLLEFYEDRFRYEGLKYSQLHPEDQRCFLGHTVSVGRVSGLSTRQKVEVFLALNTTGVPMDRDFLWELQDQLDKGEFDGD